MKRELTPKEIIYNLNSERKWEGEEYSQDIEYFEILKKIEMSLSIKNDGFNLYIIDNYSKDKMEKIINYVKFIYEKYERPKDICYVTFEDVKAPQVLYLNNCGGIKLKEKLEIIQEIYSEKIFSFYNSSINKEKESVMEYVQKQRNIYIGSLMDMAKTEGFDVKQTKIGFVFIPLKEGMTMTEREYDDLELLSKDEIINRALKLKEDAEDVINKLKDVENESIQRVKNIFSDYLEKEMQELKKDIEKEFENDLQALDYLSYVCSYIEEKVVEKYSFSYEDDEESITEIIYRFMVNVLVDNSMNRCPPVIFEQDPNINNLIGNIEYENRNGVYSTDISLIKAGSILKANEGCIILRLNDLLTNPGGYYYLKKVLLTGKINLDYNKGYLEFISLSGLKPMEIEVKVKVLLLGDYESYDILYHHDEDFKNIFKIRVQYMEEKGLSSELLEAVNKSIKKIIEGNKLLPIKQDGIKEIVKRLSRKAGSRKKISFDINEVERLLILSNNMAEAKGKNHIEAEDIINLAYEKDIYEEETLDLYKNKKILFTARGKKIGNINGLSVVDSGYFSFGKPVKITCICCKGEGAILDSQKESNLSGSIHEKSISILKGYINKFIFSYEKIPVDFHMSFEQIYGKIDGDSASVAEAVCMLSSLCKIPIRQNIAVTGSMDQFGEVQAVGGINEKIEGFFNVCKAVDSVKDKAVLIPEANIDDIVLNPEVEEAVRLGYFKIFTMENIEDAVEVLMSFESYSVENIYNTAREELKKYTKYKDKL